MLPNEVRHLLASARRAVLGTVGPDGRPHLVPVVYALVGDDLVTAIDHKPKTTRRLRRLVNVAADPRVTVLVDEYDEDWTRLWWVRIDGLATVGEEAPAGGEEALVARYSQHATRPPEGPWIVVRPVNTVTWTASGPVPPTETQGN